MFDEKDMQQHMNSILLSRIAGLEREREELLRELGELRHGTGQTWQEKMVFAAKMSHDMRTPLARIMGFTEIMRDGMAGPVTEEQKEYLCDVYESCRQLQMIINELTVNKTGVLDETSTCPNG